MQKCHSTLVPDSFKRCILFIPISFLSISMTIFSFFTFTVSFSHSDKKKKIIWLAISCALSSPVHCHLLCIASLHCQCALPDASVPYLCDLTWREGKHFMQVSRSQQHSVRVLVSEYFNSVPVRVVYFSLFPVTFRNFTFTFSPSLLL